MRRLDGTINRIKLYGGIAKALPMALGLVALYAAGEVEDYVGRKIDRLKRRYRDSRGIPHEIIASDEDPYVGFFYVIRKREQQ